MRYELSTGDLAGVRTARNDVHWGDQSLVGHLWNFLGLSGLKATVRFADEPIVFSAAAYEDRKVAAVEAREAVLRISAAGDNLKS
jgi:hypothetical protein